LSEVSQDTEGNKYKIGLQAT